MDLIKKYDGRKLTITVRDKIDTTTAPDFENEIMDEIGKFDSLTIDFTDLEYISSAGLRVLISIGKKSKPKRVPFVIKVNDTIKEILVMSGFDKFLKIK